MPDDFAIAAVVPLGKPVKQLTKLKREAVEDLVVRERFDGTRSRAEGGARACSGRA